MRIVIPARPGGKPYAARIAAQFRTRPVILFRHDHANFCPGCQGNSWNVGRACAECAGCGEVLPFFSPSPN